MPSLTVENYLKAVWLICSETGSETVATGQISAALKVSPGTVTSMLKTLSDGNLAIYKPYEGVRLTKAGRAIALRVLRRHRLLELFLVRTLDLQWDEVHDEAEHMEHAVSDLLIDRIDAFLGHPVADPHGDPIPTAEGVLRGKLSQAVPLSSCAPGARVKIVRVLNQQPEFLRYLAEHGLSLGSQGVVQENRPEAGIINSQFGDSRVSLGHPAASQLLVEADSGKSG